MSALKKLLIIVVVLVAIVAAIPLLFPYDRYKADIEQAVSARLDIPVSISDIAFSYDPKPQLALKQLTMGKQGEAEIAQIIVPITLRNLINLRTELTDVVLEQAQFKQDFALSLPGRLKPNPGGRDINFAKLKLKDLTIQLTQRKIGPLSGTLQLNQDGTFKLVTLTDADERATLTIKPEGDKFGLDFTANNWVAPGPYPDARFDQLILRGVADKDGILIDDVQALIFGSPAVGVAQLSWVEGWKLTGSLQTRSMQVEPLISLASATTRSTGRMAATADFEFSGDSYENLFSKRRVSVKFSVRDGNLHNFDLITPLKSQSPSVLQRGGQTRFDTLAGEYLLEDTQVSLRSLQLNSGKFSASGGLTISPERKLGGRINTRLSSGSIVVNAPLAIAGTLDAPELRSAGAYKPGSSENTTQIF